MSLKFLWNGIKDTAAPDKGLQRVWYSFGNLIAPHHPETITIYAKEYGHLSAGVSAVFNVKNDTDYQTDYFDKDTIRVAPDHPLYKDVKAAYEAQEQHRAKVSAKRAERRGMK